ncbi:Zn-dependent dipeptidase, microsomal dipeptidase [Desulfosporosinus acidiphilus SJ4]|uniref:Zn-dependent dipeptidase, microsomal dipeptidase n=1 Tax=Desulfosporosinus acidiphilus (strain DSM 22704 / JCM 16185 / SJ4) TaxID=646529 RepID=I4D8I2_DESAJ|nr:dipeptidase [Desulfosporosinus acidiphilus]AFM42106.1 Zn-dependent dipeptidase, microsomal dipeptidase [Desulfosporosinus acidiphilus SJ4]
MDKVFIVDGHCDSIGYLSSQTRTLLLPSEGGHWDVPRAKSADISLQFMAAFIESKFKPSLATLRGLELIETAQRFVEENPDQLFLIKNQSDLNQIPDPTRIGVLLSVEGGEIIGENLFMLDIIYRLGVRALGLTWNQRNALGDGVWERETKSRLTNLGQDVIRRMNQLGMLIDVSHLNENGFWHVLELSEYPIAATHSCAYSLCPNSRNLTDSQLRALGEHKGIVGVNFNPGFLKENGPVTRKDVVRHISYIAEVAGVETVGLGSDFDGIEETPDGLENVSDLSYLLDDLTKAGFSTKEIEQISGRNFMRLLSGVLK